MIWFPSLLRVRFGRRNRRVGIWLPLFLIWLPVSLFVLALFPFVLVLAVLLWPVGWSRPLLLACPLLFRLFYSLRGLRIDVEGKNGQVYVAIM